MATAERATGIAGNQGSRRTAATESREAGKGRLRKIAPWFAGILVMLAILTWWRNLPEKKASDRTTTATQPKDAGVSRHGRMDGTEGQANWPKMEDDGTLPIGEWSLETTVPFGCGVHFGGGHYTRYRARYRTHTPEWRDVEQGKEGSISPSHLQFKILPEGQGVKKVPFEWNCPGR